MKNIKLFVMDIDGTLTDGKIYMGENGEICKAFDVKDGFGVNVLLPDNGIKTAVITGRTSKIAANRAKELHVDFLYQGIKNKLPVLKKLAEENGISMAEIAYIGDDLPDIECMVNSGLKGCPADAVKEVRAICDFISDKEAGKGAVRDFIEYIIE